MAKCRDCSRDVYGPYSRCDTCRERRRAGDRKRYYAAKDNRQCVTCGTKLLPDDQGVRCKKCATSRADYQRSYRERQKDEEKLG